MFVAHVVASVNVGSFCSLLFISSHRRRPMDGDMRYTMYQRLLISTTYDVSGDICNMRYVSGDIQMDESKVSQIVVHLYMYVAGDIPHTVESL